MGFIINPYQVQPSVPAFTGLLDTYSGSSAAYSVARRLSSTYTGALIRVRRSSDNTEQDIGYDSNNVLDESALTSFVGANSGFVVKVYDQSGNVKDLTQSTAASQPKIVNSGSVIKDNSLPVLDFTSGGQRLENALLGSSRVDQYFVVNSLSDTVYVSVFRTTLTSFYGFVAQSGSSSTSITGGYGSPSLYANNSLFSGTTRNDVYNALIGRKLTVHENCNTFSIIPGDTWDSYVFGDYGIGVNYDGYLSEWIIWNSDQSSNRTGIQTNINTFYSIY
jgi:hypothetical protein